MTIAQLSGAYKNAGDFLIEERSRKLLEYVYPNAKIIKYLRTEIREKFSEINNSDVIIFTGGPLYQKDMDRLFDLSVCMNFRPPIMIFGGGGKGLFLRIILPTYINIKKRLYHFCRKLIKMD